MNPTLKLAAPLVAALAVAACNSGGTSGMPGVTGAAAPQTRTAHATPQWQAKHLAKAACPQVIGQPTCLALTVTGIHDTSSPSGWEPADLETAYNLPSATKGSGQIVAIVDAYDNPDVASDLATYRSQFGLGTANFTKYNQYGQQGNYPSGSTGWGVEIDLDVQMVSAACPLCTIYLIEANGADTGDLETAEAEAVTLGAHIISNSWICYGSSCGTSESSFDTPGVVYLAGSGDAGYDENGPPEWFPSVVSVGGTQLEKSGSTYTETVWPDAGGGCSSNGGSSGQPKPKWQHDPDCTYRTDSDVSSEAGCSPGVAEYDSYGFGGWGQECGTSAASPLNAAVYGLAGNASGRHAAKKFWRLHAKRRNAFLHDITSGSDGSCNGEYLCTAGTHQFKTYAGPTGWGSPSGTGAY